MPRLRSASKRIEKETSPHDEATNQLVVTLKHESKASSSKDAATAPKTKPHATIKPRSAPASKGKAKVTIQNKTKAAPWGEWTTDPPFTLPSRCYTCPVPWCPSDKYFASGKLNEHMKVKHGWPRKRDMISGDVKQNTTNDEEDDPVDHNEHGDDDDVEMEDVDRNDDDEMECSENDEDFAEDVDQQTIDDANDDVDVEMADAIIEENEYKGKGKGKERATTSTQVSSYAQVSAEIVEPNDNLNARNTYAAVQSSSNDLLCPRSTGRAHMRQSDALIEAIGQKSSGRTGLTDFQATGHDAETVASSSGTALARPRSLKLLLKPSDKSNRNADTTMEDVPSVSQAATVLESQQPTSERPATSNDSTDHEMRGIFQRNIAQLNFEGPQTSPNAEPSSATDERRAMRSRLQSMLDEDLLQVNTLMPVQRARQLQQHYQALAIREGASAASKDADTTNPGSKSDEPQTAKRGATITLRLKKDGPQNPNYREADSQPDQ